MGLKKDFPFSPFDVVNPESRWTPDLSTTSEKDFSGLSAPFVQKIRKNIFDWRRNGYQNISNTSRSLLNFWFETEHQDNFRYYFAQRESVESIIYLFEHESLMSTKELLKFDSWGTLTENILKDNWLRFVLKQATGTGKTKVMSLLIAWSYFHKLYEHESRLSKNILLLAPNTIVLDRLKGDIDSLKVFKNDPVLPTNGIDGHLWQSDFKPTVHIQDNIGKISKNGNIFLTNIQRFSNRTLAKEDESTMEYFLGKKPVTKTTDDKITVKDIVNNIDDIIIINDEAHHIHEENAWLKSIETIHNNLVQKGRVLPVQIDLTATPKHKKGEIFIQTVADYPLVEAIHQNVVKKPVIPDNASRRKLEERPSSNFAERYRDFINLGVVEWRKEFAKHKKLNKKALLFVMVDDTKNCDDVANYLENTVPELKNGTFVIHTKDNGKIDETSAKGQKELAELRKMVNQVDYNENNIKAIISVLMLKEGWDVKNVTTIVGLRAYASKILPEQTLGRGLRRMYFGEDITEELNVIGTPNFMEFVEGITKEGVELEEKPMGEGPDIPSSGPNVIEIEKEKDLDELDIDIPEIMQRYDKDYLSLEELNPNDFEFTPLKIKNYTEEERKKNFVFRDLITGEFNHEIQLDTAASLSYQSIIGFFVSILMRELRLANIGIDYFLYEKLKVFIKYKLFGQEVDLENIEILRNLTELDVGKAILDIFKSEINNLMLKDMGFRKASESRKISETQTYLRSGKYTMKPRKSIFNIIVGDAKFEVEFAEFLDAAIDVKSFFKNDIQLKYSIDYIKEDGSIGRYHPDFYLTLNNGERWVVETKGAEELNAQRKIKRLKVWCDDATLTQEVKWDCLYVRQEVWNNLPTTPNSFEEIVSIFGVSDST